MIKFDSFSHLNLSYFSIKVGFFCAHYKNWLKINCNYIVTKKINFCEAEMKKQNIFRLVTRNYMMNCK